MVFEDPFIGILLIFLLPVFLLFYLKRQKKTNPVIRFPHFASLKKAENSKSLRYRHVIFLLRMLAIVFIFLALMRPQKGIVNTKIQSEGIDIVLALDVSTSMRAEDFILGGKRYNRLYVVKEVVKDFIKKRKDDRIGIVVFSGRAYTQCPLTLDYGVLLQFLDRIEIGMIEDGTAIGDGIAAGVNRLRKTESKSKVLILLTDGNNNAGTIDPQTAAELAKAVDVKVYTIGVGGKGRVPYPVQDIFGNKVYQWHNIQLDDGMLKEIGRITEAQYFNATDTKGLKEIYNLIDKLEKTEIELDVYMEYEELFVYFLLFAVFLLLLENILSLTKYRVVL